MENCLKILRILLKFPFFRCCFLNLHVVPHKKQMDDISNYHGDLHLQLVHINLFFACLDIFGMIDNCDLQSMTILTGSLSIFEFALMDKLQVSRASASAVAFGMGLFSDRGNLGPGRHRAFAVISESRASDIMLRFHDCCQNYKARSFLVILLRCKICTLLLPLLLILRSGSYIYV